MDTIDIAEVGEYDFGMGGFGETCEEDPEQVGCRDDGFHGFGALGCGDPNNCGPNHNDECGYYTGCDAVNGLGAMSVREAQEMLGVKVDGQAGPATAKAVREFQEDWNHENPNDKIAVDGKLGPATYARLEKNAGYKNVVNDPRANAATQAVVAMTTTAPGQQVLTTESAAPAARLAVQARGGGRRAADDDGEDEDESFLMRHGRKIAIGVAVAGALGIVAILVSGRRRPAVAGLGMYGARKRRKRR